MNLKGGPVFYKRKLLAICLEQSDDTLLKCVDVRLFNRITFTHYLRVTGYERYLESLRATGSEDFSSQLRYCLRLVSIAKAEKYLLQ